MCFFLFGDVGHRRKGLLPRVMLAPSASVSTRTSTSQTIGGSRQLGRWIGVRRA
jgi:hypothetical protein